jgi:hypothetical protein
VESTLGVGSTFVFTLPTIEPPRGTERPAAVDADPAAGVASPA